MSQKIKVSEFILSMVTEEAVIEGRLCMQMVYALGRAQTSNEDSRQAEK